MYQTVHKTAVSDPRIVGLVDYGSSSEGRDDEWSDVDVALFIRDDDFDAFWTNWQTWAAQFGELLLAYVSGVGHPWAVYAGQPLPLRVDFHFLRASDTEEVKSWTKSPKALRDLVLYDDTNGRLSHNAQSLINQSLEPDDPATMYATICGDFWYYALRLIGKIERQSEWMARWEFNFIIIGNLTALMRLESGQMVRWRATHAVDGIETAVSSHRLTQLNCCIPGHGLAEIRRALHDAAQLGYEVCQSLQQTHDWMWPQTLADIVLAETINN